jgi:hypothetical protein
MLSTPPRLIRATASLTDAATPPATLAQPNESGTFSTKRAPFFIFIWQKLLYLMQIRLRNQWHHSLRKQPPTKLGPQGNQQMQSKQLRQKESLS